MYIYDKVYEFARELKNAPEVVNYKRALEKINANEKHKKMVEDLRKMQFEIYSMQLQGKQPSKEQMEAFENISNIISLNPEVKEFLEAEMRFLTLWQDIFKIITDTIGININPNL
ncbi:Cell fate regulator YlbF, YheA/YmcA/DUF963 family (controls sporulation, competence, biofilm development) [Caloramator fervidus]|uniref:UPF0342 protein SAMN05660865_01075 n=1 Tax=Caloramator fervidus TaxID=29344 RepID=A0A1H5V3L1_9CLOT|nr:YlbF family regulator [Caloramator fervidus]SEF81321.1 Cell fate regulator YlbF, YheA/YmcA/DUF963 family (controls sporulation, competence, biofilm development) [Caloramator fervidus]